MSSDRRLFDDNTPKLLKLPLPCDYTVAKFTKILSASTHLYYSFFVGR